MSFLWTFFDTYQDLQGVQGRDKLAEIVQIHPGTAVADDLFSVGGHGLDLVEVVEVGDLVRFPLIGVEQEVVEEQPVRAGERLANGPHELDSVLDFLRVQVGH